MMVGVTMGTWFPTGQMSGAKFDVSLTIPCKIGEQDEVGDFATDWVDKRLGKLVRYVPYPVVAGFLAATGWLMLAGAIRMTTGVTLSWTTLPSLVEPQSASLLGVTIIWAAALWLLTARIKHALVLPLALVAAIILADLVLSIVDLPADTVAASGLMFSVPGGHAAFPASGRGGRPRCDARSHDRVRRTLRYAADSYPGRLGIEPRGQHGVGFDRSRRRTDSSARPHRGRGPRSRPPAHLWWIHRRGRWPAGP